MEIQDYQKIKIDDIEYFIIDSIQNFRIEDSFIQPSNKLAEYGGHGEGKKYVGIYKGEKNEDISNFFEYSKWGIPHFDKTKKRKTKTISSALELGAVIQKNTCFFSKVNLLKYLEDARGEYFSQEQIYHRDISQNFEKRLNEIKNLPTNSIYFSIYDSSDNWDASQNRGYIRSDDYIWELFRSLVLPKITYLSILKLQPVNITTNSNYPLFYFRILLDFQFRTFIHPSMVKSKKIQKIDDIQDERQKRKYRRGQTKFKEDVHDLMPACPFTRISDERLLIASHIKPYQVCMNEGREDQAIDKFNGLSLSPTYDVLFDEGYITFLDNGNLICGSLLSPYTWEKLNINPNAKNSLRIYPEGRYEYLEYHRQYIFREDISNFL